MTNKALKGRKLLGYQKLNASFIKILFTQWVCYPHSTQEAEEGGLCKLRVQD